MYGILQLVCHPLSLPPIRRDCIWSLANSHNIVIILPLLCPHQSLYYYSAIVSRQSPIYMTKSSLQTHPLYFPRIFGIALRVIQVVLSFKLRVFHGMQSGIDGFLLNKWLAGCQIISWHIYLSK